MSTIPKLGSRIRNWNLPVRSNAYSEPIPVVHVWRGNYPSWASQNFEEGNVEIRSRSINSLTINHDCCVWPVQCRYFSLEVSDQPYYPRSLSPFFERRFKPSVPHKLYITKECALRVSGFRPIRQECPFKSVKDLNSYESKNIRTSTPAKKRMA
jgi:hypothetical protein